MSQTTKLSVALLLILSAVEAFAPHCNHRKPSFIALRAQRQTNKKRRFLQSAHPIPPTQSSDKSEAKNRWTASKSSAERRIKPPLQTSKSIEELEAILEKRWGVADNKSTEKDDDFVMSFEKPSSNWNADSDRPPSTRGAAVLKSKWVADPWERAEKLEQKYSDEVNTGSAGDYRKKKDRWFSKDEALLKRVRSNQLRLNNKKDRKTKPKSGGDSYDISVDNKDYYDQDDEGYENGGTMISPQPVGGRGKSAALEGGIFSARTGKISAKVKEPVTAAAARTDKKKKKKPKQNEPMLESMLDEDGNPMYLTLEQADKIVENILSDQDSTGVDSERVLWEDIGITNSEILYNLQSTEMICPFPLEVQVKACPPIIAGNDVLLSTHTGSGKTLSFLAPIAQNIMVNPSNSPLPKALIVAPGRELASQIVSVAQKLFLGTELTVGMVIGGTSYARNVEMLRTKKPDVVVGTPGRIAELIMGRSGDK